MIITINVSRPLLAFLTIIAGLLFLLAVYFKFVIFAILGLFLIINNILNFFRKIEISEHKAMYYAIFTQRNIRYVESIHCTGFWIFNCIRINGNGISEIKLYGVANYTQVVEFSGKL